MTRRRPLIVPRYLFLTVLLVATLLAGSFGWRPQPALAASCATSGPTSGAYSVTICLTQPLDGALVVGNTTISATVTTSGAAARVQHVLFSLDGSLVLTDFFAPYTFLLPTAQWVDGSHQLSASAFLSDGFTSAPTSLTLFFRNGVTSPPPLPTGFQTSTGTTPPSGQPFIVTAAGDGPDGGAPTAAVAQLIGALGSNLFLYLGDVYDDGTYTEFVNYYGTNGQLFDAYRAITLPVVGNHEYEGGDAPGYFRYWNSPPNYYSVDAGGWHFIALNSTSQFGQYTPGTPQYEWLLRDLQANRDECTIVFFHHPRFSIGPQGDTPALQDIWELLDAFGVEVVLTGHDHNYQRWVPLDGMGQPSPTGVVQIVAGTSGHGIRGFVRSDSRVAFGLDRPPDAYGLARLALSATGAEYSFVDLQGQVRDRTTITCHGPNDTTPPTTPTGLTARLTGPTQVDLTWTASSDNVALDAYEVLRDGTRIATVPASTRTYRDATVQPGRTYSYQVIAIDVVGNRSAASSPATITLGALFADDFETGNLSKWSTVQGLSVTTTNPHGGSYAAQANSTRGTRAYAVGTLATASSDVQIETWFMLVTKGNNSVTLVRWLSSSGTGLGNVFVTNNGRLAFRNERTGSTITTTTTVTTNTWHRLVIRVTTGTAGRVELSYDGAPLLQSSQNFGNNSVGRLQIGEHNTKRTFDVRFDDVLVGLPPAPPPDTTPPDTTLTSTPQASTTETSATFAFTASEPATFQCSLDGAAAQPCSSPLTYTGLTIGTHTFAVSATDLAGNTDPSPATYAWEIVAPSAPETTLTSTPPQLTNSASATFTFTASDPAATFECQLDAEPTVVCTSPWTLTGLAEGSHTFSVRAVDGEGDADLTPATWTWTIDLTPPPPPADLHTTAVSGSSVRLAWSPVSDANGIDGYDVLRNGTLLVRLGPVTEVTDSSVQPQTNYTYTVRARDVAGNVSGDSNTVTVSTGSLRLFEDDFESGTLTRWASVSGLTITSEAPYAGAFAAQALSTSGTAAYAIGTLAQPASDLYVRLRFNLVSQGANNVYVVKWRSGTATSLGGLYVTSTGRLGFRNDVTGQSTTTTVSVSQGSWHTLEVHVRVGSTGLLEVWYDGTRVFQSSQNFGTDPITRIQIGENSTGRTFDLRFDDVAADTAPIEAPPDTTPPETTLTSTPPATTTDTSATFAFTASELATFQCSLDGAPGQLCTSPVTYTGLSVGTHTFTVSATDLAANTDPTPATFSWTITSAPAAPETTLTSTPDALTNRTDATFAFTSDDPTATFRCQLDSQAAVSCTSPWTVTGLAEGDHTVAIWAVNAAGTPDPTPATFAWRIDLTPPTTPLGLTATAGNGRAILTWQASADANGLAGYEIRRDGTFLATVGEVTSYTDSTVQANTTYTYTVLAIDRAGNRSPESTPVTITTGAFLLFSDDFESGTLDAWTTVSGLTITTESPYAGTYAARALSTSGTAAYAITHLSTSATELYVRIRFYVAAQGANTVYVVKLRTSTGSSIGGVFISSTGKLGFRNDIAGQSTTTTTTVTQGTWHTLSLHVVIGSTGTVDITYDGTVVATVTGNLGTASVGRFQLGENSTGRTFDVRFDDVAVDTAPIAG